MPNALTHTGSASFSNLKINRPISVIGIKSTVDLANELITIKWKTPQGQIVLAENFPARALAEMAQFGEGSVFQTGTVGAASYRQNNRISLVAPDEGSLQANDSNPIVIEMANMQAGETYEIQTIAYPGISDSFLQYEKIDVEGSSTGTNSHQLDFAGNPAYKVSSDVTNVTKWEIIPHTGEEIEYDATDLDMLQHFENDIMATGETMVYGHNNYYTMGAIMFRRLKITGNATAFGIFVSRFKQF